MAALNFPSSPTLDQTYTANGLTWRWNGVSWVTQDTANELTIAIGTVAPTSPANGNMWWKTDEGRLKIYYADGDSSQWVDAYPAFPGPNQITTNTLSGLTGLLLGSGGYVATTANMTWSETYKQLSVGGSSWVSAMLSVGGTTPTTSNFSEAFVVAPTLHAACTSGSHIMSWLYTEPATALTSHTHYMARQGTLGAGTTITTQYGYIASSTLTGATNNYGFYSAIASGTGRWNFYANGTANNYFAGNVGIAVTPSEKLHVSGNALVAGQASIGVGLGIQPNTLLGLGGTLPSSGGASTGAYMLGTAPSTTTSAANGFATFMGTAAATFTCASVNHFVAYQGTFGAGSTVTNQYGFKADGSLIDATNNYGFHSNIASGTGRWNFYAAGTAANYFNGATTFNSAVTMNTALAIGSGGTGATTATGALTNIGAAGAQADIWGDGSDGNVTVSTSVTLTKDMYYNNLTLSAGAAINTNGYRIFVAGILDISAAPAGALTSNGGAGGAGGNGTVAAGGAAGTVGAWGGINFLVGPSQGLIGKAGGYNTIPTAPLNGNSNYQLANPVSYAGASGGGNAALANNGASAYTGQRTLFASGFFVWAGLPDTSQMSNITVTGGAVGGGGGASAATCGGGGGGGPGGCAGQVVLVAKTIARGTNTTAGIIQAKGGAGGVGGNAYTVGNGGGGGGGQGGHGGYVTIIYNAFSGSTISNAIDVSGGQGGNGGTGTGTYRGGQGASSGAGGCVSIVLYPAMTRTYYEYTAGTAGSTPTTTAGAAGAAINTRQVAL